VYTVKVIVAYTVSVVMFSNNDLFNDKRGNSKTLVGITRNP